MFIIVHKLLSERDSFTKHNVNQYISECLTGSNTSILQRRCTASWVAWLDSVYRTGRDGCRPNITPFKMLPSLSASGTSYIHMFLTSPRGRSEQQANSTILDLTTMLQIHFPVYCVQQVHIYQDSVLIHMPLFFFNYWNFILSFRNIVACAN